MNFLHYGDDGSEVDRREPARRRHSSRQAPRKSAPRIRRWQCYGRTDRSVSRICSPSISVAVSQLALSILRAPCTRTVTRCLPTCAHVCYTFDIPLIGPFGRSPEHHRLRCSLSFFRQTILPRATFITIQFVWNKARGEGGGRLPAPRAWSEPESHLLGQQRDA